MYHFHNRRLQIFVFLLVLTTAVIFRLPKLDTVPPGLYPDEAMNGNNALQALENNNLKIFYPENNGREGLHINAVAASFKIFGAHTWSLRLPSVIAGLLSIIALYLLGKELFSWQIGALSSFLMAVSFWHVNFSRISFRVIWAPLFLTLTIYFLWKGLKGRHFINFLFSGIFLGLGFYTYLAFRITPLILGVILLAYWHFLKKDFGQDSHRDTHFHLSRGLVLMFLSAFIVVLPLGMYFWLHPQDFLGRSGQLSVFSSPAPLKTLLVNVVQTLGSFNFTGDFNWRHNFSGRPLLWWPIGVFFAAGFLRNLIKLFKHRKNHGHFSITPVCLLSWFFLGLTPVIFSNEGLPHALRTLIVAPVAFLFAGEGAWWLFGILKRWCAEREKSTHEASLIATAVLVILMTSIALAEFRKYFIDWAHNPSTAIAFDQKYLQIGQAINQRPDGMKTYIVVEAGGTLVDNIPMPAQTVMFVTQTYDIYRQNEKKVFYLLPDEFEQRKNEILRDSSAEVFYLR